MLRNKATEERASICNSATKFLVQNQDHDQSRDENLLLSTPLASVTSRQEMIKYQLIKKNEGD